MAKDHIADYDTTAGNNTDVDGVDVNEACAPSGINNAIREVMADLAEWYGDIGGALTSTNSGNDYSLTTNDSVAAYAAGQLYTFIVNAASTGAATLNINTIGAKAIKKHHDLALESGDLEASQIVVVAYKATEDVFQLLTPTAAGAAIIQGTHTIWVPAAAMTPAVTSGCQWLSYAETTAGRPDIVTIDFDKDSDEFAQFSIAMPKSWNEGTVTFIPYWTHKTSTAAYGVVWFLQGVAVSNDDTIDVAYGTAVGSTDAGGTDEDLYVGPTSAAITIGGTPAAGDNVFFQIYRDVSDGSDTLDADACLIGINILITIDAKDDS